MVGDVCVHVNDGVQRSTLATILEALDERASAYRGRTSASKLAVQFRSAPRGEHFCRASTGLLGVFTEVYQHDTWPPRMANSKPAAQSSVESANGLARRELAAHLLGAGAAIALVGCGSDSEDGPVSHSELGLTGTGVTGTNSLAVQASVGAASISLVTAMPPVMVRTWIAIEPFSSNCELVKIVAISGSTISFAPALTRVHPTGSRVAIVEDGCATPQLFGALADGVNNDTGALLAAIAASPNVILPRGIYNVGTSGTTLGTDTDSPVKTLRFQAGAMLKCGSQLTIKAKIEAGWSQIFLGASGVAPVVGLRHARPQWWGAKGDLSADAQPALQAAHDSLSTNLSTVGGSATLELGAGQFLLNRTLTFRPQQNVSLRVIGCGVTGAYGSRFVVNNGFGGTNLAAVQIAGQVGGLAPIADFVLENFAVVRNDSSSAQVGISFGEVNKSLIAVEFNEVRNVYVERFSVGIRIAQTRLVRFDRCSTDGSALPSSKGVVITLDNNSTKLFTGDLVFRDCQFVAANLASNWCVEVISANANQEGIAGIKFFNCTFYHAGRALSLWVGAGCAIADLWVDQCQFDGIGTEGIRAEALQSGAVGAINDFRVTNCYFQGFSSTAL